jgi:PAS domain S-box-containing protein
MQHWQPNPYAIALLISALIAGVVAWFTWRCRPRTGAVAITMLLLGACIWSLGYAIGIGIADLAARIFWAKVQHIGIALLGPSVLIFALEYAGAETFLRWRNRLLIAVVPCLGLVLAWTNEAHHLIWTDLQVDFFGAIPILELRYGVYFWIYTVYIYLLLAISTYLLVRLLARRSRLQRAQSSIILLGMMVPWVGNLLYLTRWSPFPRLDLTPFTYSVSGVVIAWGLFRYRLLNVVPIARDRVIEQMNDAFIVLDDRNVFIDLNPPALAILGMSASAVLGKPAAQVLRPWQHIVDSFATKSEGQIEITLGSETEPRYYDVRVSQLRDRDSQLLGRLIILQDSTARKHSQTMEQMLAQREMQLAGNIQASLLPQSTPRIPGLDLAGVSMPCQDIGGDLFNYYELPLSPENPRAGYALVIGDVSGKGVPAALYMAVTTIMLAGKTPFVTDVTQLFQEMNAALYPYMSPNNMNIAMGFVRLECDEAQRYTAHIGTAGMIAPLLRRGAQCAHVEVSGLPLGVIPANLQYTTVQVALQPGDMLILCSDGLVEAMNDSREMYGFERLAERVNGGPSTSAQAMLEWLIGGAEAFMDGAGLHDDLTLMVVLAQAGGG